jgi:hypothetical protein
MQVSDYIENHKLFLQLRAQYRRSGKTPSKDERVTLLFCLLNNLPSSFICNESKVVCDAVLNFIEDNLSGVPSDPTAYRSDGRLYPAMSDQMIKSKHADVQVYRHVSHVSLFGSNGAFLILNRRFPRGSEPLVDRAGTDGRKIGDLVGCPAQEVY